MCLLRESTLLTCCEQHTRGVPQVRRAMTGTTASWKVEVYLVNDILCEASDRRAPLVDCVHSALQLKMA
jgi:hypothetical protein